MAVYFFDFRAGEELIVDEEGIELRDMEAAQHEAARSLADAMHSDGTQAKLMAVEVRDVYGPVLEVRFAFETSAGTMSLFLWPLVDRRRRECGV